MNLRTLAEIKEPFGLHTIQPSGNNTVDKGPTAWTKLGCYVVICLLHLRAGSVIPELAGIEEDWRGLKRNQSSAEILGIESCSILLNPFVTRIKQAEP
jgi:hypothetical protein